MNYGARCKNATGPKVYISQILLSVKRQMLFSAGSTVMIPGDF